jgi:uncharacterized LabA/DUF88 family protein
MVFVDGENFAIRYKTMLNNMNPEKHIFYKDDVFVWSKGLNDICSHAGVIRKYYYTSFKGAEEEKTKIEESLKSYGIETTRVFKKYNKRGSKQVDISLSTDMLMHAFRKNYETAVLVAGDEDYVPLVEAVKLEGRRVILWFLEDGLSPLLKRTADWYKDVGELLFAKEINPNWR